MLVLSRKVGERIRINDEIVVTVLAVVGSRVRVGIEAPSSVTILREELYEREGPAGSRRPLAKAGAGMASLAEESHDWF
jgi:carbon storage regulator